MKVSEIRPPRIKRREVQTIGMDFDELPELIQAEDARIALGLGRSLFYASCGNGDLPLPLLRLGVRGIAYVRKADLRALLAGSHVNQMEPENG